MIQNIQPEKNKELHQITDRGKISASVSQTGIHRLNSWVHTGNIDLTSQVYLVYAYIWHTKSELHEVPAVSKCENHHSTRGRREASVFAGPDRSTACIHTSKPPPTVRLQFVRVNLWDVWMWVSVMRCSWLQQGDINDVPLAELLLLFGVGDVEKRK